MAKRTRTSKGSGESTKSQSAKNPAKSKKRHIKVRGGKLGVYLKPIEDDEPEGLPREQLESQTEQDDAKARATEKFLKDLKLTEHPLPEIYKYLASMPKCVEVLKKRRGDVGTERGGKKPLDNTNVIVIHHLDDKAFGAMAVLREWGGTDMTAILVGYNPAVFSTYFPDIRKMKKNKFRACIIGGKTVSGSNVSAAKDYEMLQDYNWFPESEKMPNEELDVSFSTGFGNKPRMTYLEAMRCLSLFIFLRTLKRSRVAEKKLLIFEDGGYLNPIINAACLEGRKGITIAKLRDRFKVPADPSTDAELPENFNEALEGTFVGTTEWTRNGYDRSMMVQEKQEKKEKRGKRGKKYPKMAYPLFSMACSQLKTRIEGDSIAIACLNAITQILYAKGLTLKHRHVMVIGSRGNIGRFFCDHLANLLDDPTRQMLACDLKVDWPPKGDADVPGWTVSPHARVENCLYEASAWKKFPTKYLRDVDLVFGLSGGPSAEERPTVSGDDLEDWLANGTKPQIFFASGSTKQAEYSDMLQWLDETKSSSDDGRTVRIKHRELLKITSRKIDDPLGNAAVRTTTKDQITTSKTSYGTEFRFTLGPNKRETKEVRIKKTVYLLNDTKPINFKFYGTPTEIIEISLAQLVDITAHLAEAHTRGEPQLKDPQVFAVGYKQVATAGVFKAEDLDADYKVPGSPSSTG